MLARVVNAGKSCTCLEELYMLARVVYACKSCTCWQELYMLAREVDSKLSHMKFAILLSADALERYNHFKWDDPPVDPPELPMPTNKLTFNLFTTMPVKPMC